MQEINQNEITLLWHLGYYDGYLSGIAKYLNKIVYVNFIEDNPELYNETAEDFTDDLSWYRKFAVIELSAEQIDFEFKRHEDFESHVGTHTNYYEGKRKNGIVHPREEWDFFYKKYANIKTDYSKNNVLGFYYK